MTSSFRVAILLVSGLVGILGGATARAQNSSQFSKWKPSIIDGPAVKPKLDCSALVSSTGYEFSIDTAVLVPAASETPEHCNLFGQILPEIQFELSLPTNWNGRLYMFGNGGFAGENLSAPGRVNTRNRALKHGFAVAQTNTGHDAAIEPLGTFGVNRQKFLDYAYRAVHVTVETSKELIRTYYGNAATRSYFDGCSTGGRQGLMSAQRFPDDFDGIVVGAPILDFTGTMTSSAWNARALSATSIPPEKLKILAQRVYAKCDRIDGLADGLIDDPRRCAFSPPADLPVCANGGEGGECFTAAQIRALELIYRGTESGGRSIFWGQPVGAEIEGPFQNTMRSGWDPWIVTGGGRTISVSFGETFFRNFGFGRPEPNFDLKSFNFESDLARLVPTSNILDAKDVNLTRFKSRSGKILMYFGWADPALNPLMGVDYYEKVADRFGGSTTDFFRLFMVPGMFHCRGGVGPDDFDALSSLVEWVEKGVSPKQILASQSRDGKPIRTRPLCPYPQIAKYNGTGSFDDAANFACANP